MVEGRVQPKQRVQAKLYIRMKSSLVALGKRSGYRGNIFEI